MGEAAMIAAVSLACGRDSYKADCQRVADDVMAACVVRADAQGLTPESFENCHYRGDSAKSTCATLHEWQGDVDACLNPSFLLRHLPFGSEVGPCKVAYAINCEGVQLFPGLAGSCPSIKARLEELSRKKK
jgi:hypothetical protein